MALLWLLTGFLVIATLLPISKGPFGAIRGLDFPRQQYAILAAVLGACVFALVPGWLGGWGGPLVLLLAAIQIGYIAKFTRLWPVQSVETPLEQGVRRGAQVSLIAANVKLSNRSYAPLIELCRSRAPDVLVAIEVDAEWTAALRDGLEMRYPHIIDVSQDNGYGMAVFSRLPLCDTQVRELITRHVPSIKTTVSLRNKAAIRLYVVHPEPPVIDHDTRGRDSEIAVAGLEAAQDDLPAIVAGASTMWRGRPPLGGSKGCPACLIRGSDAASSIRSAPPCP